MEDGESSRGDGGSRSFGGAFSKYTPENTRGLQVAVRKSLVIRLTKDIVETFQLCNPNFKYSEGLKLKRFLTNPSVGVLNDGYDNANSDLILHVNDVLVNPATNQRYYVKDLLGQGTFGQVAKCWVPESDSFVAVKVIKNHTAYYRQALVEVSILTMLNQKLAQDEKRHIVRILDYFIYQRHLCITFEMLGSNLFEVIKMNHYRGFPLSVVQVFSKQILHALVLIKEAGIIHCDLKPENILLSASAKPEIKVIDFGSACMEGRTVYSYIQSRYYRSPEVLLGFPYTTAIDMWSFGCIVAELFLGLPLFSGASEYDLLMRMIEILDRQPPDELLRNAKDTEKFFKHIASCYRLGNDGVCNGIASAYQILTEEEFEARTSKRPIIGKRYFSHDKLEDIIANYPYRKTLSEEEISKEKYCRLALVDFLRGLVEFDPGKRWSPLQASRHPFVTGEPFIYAYKPIPETPCIPVMHAVTVDHNPGGGHWLAAGLSPQVPSSNRGFPQNSPFHHMMPVSHGNSYGSIGSYGSYNDNTALGSSFGSYNDVNSMYSYFSPMPPSNLIQTQVGGPYLGASPDTRRRPHMTHGNGFSMSPKSNVGPMSLGVSPSSQMQYGPSSPVRGGGVHGSPLGKGTGQYNKRRSWGLHENASYRLQVGHHNDGMSCHTGSPRGGYSASNHSNLKQQFESLSGNQNVAASKGFSGDAVSHSAADTLLDKRESSSSVLDPAHWDPLYSDELLLQEDNSDVSTLALEMNNNLSIGNATDILVNNNAGKSVLGQHQAHLSSSFVPPYQRTEGPIQAHSVPDSSSHHFTHDARAGNSRLPPISQNSPSRFGQQSGHRHSQHSNYNRGERTYYKVQPTRSNFPAPSDSHSASHNMLGSSAGMSWGRRGGHPGATALQSSHARKDYGRIP